MTTATAEQEKFEVSAQQFIDQMLERYPTITKVQPMEKIIAATVQSLRDLNLYRENLSVKAFWAGFNNSVQIDKTITLPAPPKVDVAAAAAQLAAKFPEVVTGKKVNKNQSTDFVNRQSGRTTHAERKEMETKSSKDISVVKDLSRLAELRTEYRALKVQAENMRGNNPRNHAETASVRKAALQKLNSDPRFREVRSE